jgi:preprotein translocase subunit SecG
MNKTTKTLLVVAFVVVVVVFMFFGSGGMMDGGRHESGWMGERSWIWIPALLTIILGVALGWGVFKKKG